jgi:hypothetical protein
MNRHLIAAATLALSWATASAPALAQGRPVVVELFTSQGCSSCPPADAVLAELATNKDVLALGFHVDYWDRLGWKDPFSTPGATSRQNEYAAQFGRKEVFTPQIVIDGQRQAVGSNRGAVLQAIAQSKAALAEPASIAPITFAADGRSVSIGAGAGRGKVLVIRYVRNRATQVQRGENAGKTAVDVNSVDALNTVGEWTGQRLDLSVDPVDADHGLAVLVQSDNGGILGAASLPAIQS